MMNKRIEVVILYVTFAACASTGPASDRGIPVASDYAPLAVGSSWSYDVEYPGQKGEMKVELIAYEDGYFLDNRKGALQHTMNGLRDHDRYLIRHPIKVGTAWKSVVGPSAVEYLQIENVGTPCETIAGRFKDCLVISGKLRRDKSMQLHIRWVWARDVGLVRVETESEITGKGRMPQVKQSLKDYSLRSKGANLVMSKDSEQSGQDDGPNTWASE